MVELAHIVHHYNGDEACAFDDVLVKPAPTITHVNGDEAAYNVEDFLVKICERQGPAKVHCRWRLSELPATGSPPRYFHTLDLLLSVFPAIDGHDIKESFRISDATGTALETLVRHVMGRDQGLAERIEVATTVILTPRAGYLCRSDILNIRMRHSQYIDGVVAFGAWDRRLSSFSTYDEPTLLPYLLCSPGAVVAKQGPLSDDGNWKLLQTDIEMRLSFEWVISKKPAAYRVALVSGRHLYDPKLVTYRAQAFLEAARALGISVTVLDDPGHWLEGKEFAHLRDDFIAVDFSSAAELPHKIADAIRGKCFDGVITFSDEFVSAATTAADLLGLPSEPLEHVLQAVHKHDLRKIVNNTNIQAMFLSGPDQLDNPAMIKQLSALRYPLIVKSAYGRASAGVKKVTGESSMREAIRLLDKDGLASDGIVLETFVDGPELDCNFVLCDGKILFAELTDDLPSSGDASDATLADDFYETVMVSNSGLPREELEILRSSLHQNLLQLGLRWGMFHAEARMQNSSMRYDDAYGNGKQDLVPYSSNGDATITSDRQPAAFLIEANIRPPGGGASWVSLFTYGVDYNALQLLRAVEDRERFEALSHPFAFPDSAGGGGGAQYWGAHCMIPVPEENIRVPEDFFQKLYESVPEVAPYVTKAELHARPGAIVGLSGGVGMIAYVLLYSRSGRQHIVEMYHRVADAARKLLINEICAE